MNMQEFNWKEKYKEKIEDRHRCGVSETN